MNNEKSIAEKDSAVKYLTDDLFTVEQVTLDGVETIDSIVSDILTRNDAVYITGDEELKNAAAGIVSAASASSKFVFSSNIGCIESGVLASTASPVKDLSYNAAADADEILRGTKPSDIPVDTDITFAIYVSKTTATNFNIDVPQIDNVILF